MVPTRARRIGVGMDEDVVDLNGPHVYKVRTALVDGRPQVLGLCVEPATNSDGTLRDERTVADVVITRETLRGIPVARIAAAAIKMRGGDLLGALREAATPPEPVGRRGHTDEHYQQVAEVVRQALAADVPVRKAVKQRWIVSVHTADKWLKQAKQRGYLTGDLRRRGGHGG